MNTRKELLELAVDAVSCLEKVVPLHRIEGIIGLEKGDLSQIRAGKKQATRSLCLLLVSLSMGDIITNLLEFKHEFSDEPVKSQVESMKEAIAFLKEREALGELFQRPDGSFAVVDCPGVRITLVDDPIATLDHVLAVYVDEDWSETDYTDLIVMVLDGRRIIEEDWPSGLCLAKLRAGLKPFPSS